MVLSTSGIVAYLNCGVPGPSHPLALTVRPRARCSPSARSATSTTAGLATASSQAGHISEAAFSGVAPPEMLHARHAIGPSPDAGETQRKRPTSCIRRPRAPGAPCRPPPARSATWCGSWSCRAQCNTLHNTIGRLLADLTLAVTIDAFASALFERSSASAPCPQRYWRSLHLLRRKATRSLCQSGPIPQPNQPRPPSGQPALRPTLPGAPVHPRK